MYAECATLINAKQYLPSLEVCTSFSYSIRH
jgi:hypothetical protein